MNRTWPGASSTVSNCEEYTKIVGHEDEVCIESPVKIQKIVGTLSLTRWPVRCTRIYTPQGGFHSSSERQKEKKREKPESSHFSVYQCARIFCASPRLRAFDAEGRLIVEFFGLAVEFARDRETIKGKRVDKERGEIKKKWFWEKSTEREKCGELKKKARWQSANPAQSRWNVRWEFAHDSE